MSKNTKIKPITHVLS